MYIKVNFTFISINKPKYKRWKNLTFSFISLKCQIIIEDNNLSLTRKILFDKYKIFKNQLLAYLLKYHNKW